MTSVPKKKVSSRLHKHYSEKQLKEVLTFLEVNYPNLHICALLVYGCLLRPHQEVRLLTIGDLDEGFTKIILDGSRNKGRTVRVVPIPEFVREKLITRLENYTEHKTNILTLTESHYNLSYLNTQWSRAKSKMIKNGILEKEHTLYSFRHTAAINVYRKTKDLNILQRLLQHSNMIVTLTYLRHLGEATQNDLRDSMPEL